MLINNKSVKMFYDGDFYKELNYTSYLDAKEWMLRETNMIPHHKRWMFYFEMQSKRNLPKKQNSNATND